MVISTNTRSTKHTHISHLTTIQLITLLLVCTSHDTSRHPHRFILPTHLKESEKENTEVTVHVPQYLVMPEFTEEPATKEITIPINKIEVTWDEAFPTNFETRIENNTFISLLIQVLRNLDSRMLDITSLYHK